MAGLLLSACAETELALHTVKTVTGGDAQESVGTYKVGKPYQIGGTWYYPREDLSYKEEGVASWYGPGFHGKLTANGETYDMNDLTAAHRTLPMPSMVRVTNLTNGRAVVLRVNDRGPFAKNRIIDVSRRAAQLLGFLEQGTARVRVEILPDESMALKAQALTKAGVMPRVEAAPRAAVQTVALETAALTEPSTPSGDKEPNSLMPPPEKPPQSRLVSLGGTTYVQAGAFSNAANAQRLEQRFAGIAPVHVVPVEVDGRQLYRVRLGPLKDPAEAERILAQVRAGGLPGAHLVSE